MKMRRLVLCVGFGVYDAQMDRALCNQGVVICREWFCEQISALSQYEDVEA